MPRKTVLKRFDLPSNRAVQILDASEARVSATLSLVATDGRDTRQCFIAPHPNVKPGTGFPMRVSDAPFVYENDNGLYAISVDGKTIFRVIETLEEVETE